MWPFLFNEITLIILGEMNEGKITAVIIDDEESSRNVLRILLNKYCPEVSLIGECGDLEDAYTTQQIKEAGVDLTQTDAGVMVCAPPAMIRDIVVGLKALGVDGSRIHHEAFGPEVV